MGSRLTLAAVTAATVMVATLGSAAPRRGRPGGAAHIWGATVGGPLQRRCGRR
jgi:hypothetical protein